MDEEKGNEGHRFDEPLASDLVSATQSLWQLPLMAFTGWWNLMVQAFWPDVHSDSSQAGTASRWN